MVFLEPRKGGGVGLGTYYCNLYKDIEGLTVDCLGGWLRILDWYLYGTGKYLRA